MQMSLLLAVAAAKAAMASQMIQNGTAAPMGHEDPMEPEARMPLTIGEFSYLGCVSSVTDFGNFKIIATSDHMALDLCAASCPSKYFATHAK